MSELKYAKTFKIEYNILKEGDIIQIAKLFEDLFEENDYQREISLYFNDDSQISSQGIDIFKTDEFRRRLCECITFKYASKGYDRKVEVTLCNSAIMTHSTSKIEIFSKDKEWYDRTINRFITILNEVEHQKPIEKYSNIITTVLSTVESSLLFFTLIKLSPGSYDNTMPFLMACIMISVLCFNYSLMAQLCKAFPRVEFAFGPAHLNPSKRIRKVLNIIVPLAVDVAFFILGLCIK